MPGTRGVVKQPPLKRRGRATAAEKELVAAIVLDQPKEMSPAQVNGLARALRRSKSVVKDLVDEAKENFVANAGRYVEIHKEATEQALATCDFETAMKGASWAIEHLSAEGSRIVDKPGASTGPMGPRIQIGIKLGGVDQPVVGVKVDDAS